MYMNRFIRFFLLNCCVFSSVHTLAEGSYQFGEALNQPFVSTTTVFVHVANPGDFIRVHLCPRGDSSADVAVNISSTVLQSEQYTADTLLASLSSSGANIDCADPLTSALERTPAIGDLMEFAVPDAGVYALTFENDADISYDRWDFSVVPADTPDASVDATQEVGNVFSYNWIFDTGSFAANAGVTGQIFILVPGGFDDSHYVWALDLQTFSGNQYEFSANDIGLDSPSSGVSAPIAGNSFTAKFPVYLSYPTAANPSPAPDQFPSLIDSLIFVDDAGGDSTISPDGDAIEESGNFEFTPDVDGTYAITIDVNRDGQFGVNDKLLLGRVEANVKSIVNWDGTDASGFTVPNATYAVKLELRLGEYHFIAEDVETSGGGLNDDGTGDNNGLTILQAIDANTLVGTQVYWDDATLLSGSANLPAGALSSTDLIGDHRHTWGNFTNTGIGNASYIDTYVFGNSSVIDVTAVVAASNTPPTINDNTFDVDENSTPGTTVGTPVSNDIDGDVLGYTIISGNEDNVFSISELTGEITVNGNLDHEAVDQYVLVVEVTDQVLTDTATITITINDNNDAPIANDQTINLAENITQDVTLTGLDQDEQPLSYTLVSAPQNGVLSGTGSDLTYTPNPGFQGEDSFTFIVNDGTLDSNIGTVNLIVESDNDGDGISDGIDTDDDNDGISDEDEGLDDTDNDGIPNNVDEDSDGDGIPDSEEGAQDTDSDGIPNYLDEDSDSDGIPDATEGAGQDLDEDGNPDYLDASSDEDKDGIPDIIEGTSDSDGDGVADYLDPDSDNDGLLDSVESIVTGSDQDGDGIDDAFDVDQTGGVDNNNDGIDDDVSDVDSDNDGSPNRLDLDSDDDGIPDVIESSLRENDADGDTYNDRVDVDVSGGEDSDNDGIDDLYDASITGGLDANLDGVDDLLEPQSDRDNDGILDYLDLDSDDDGISDTAESGISLSDLDADGIDDIFDIDETGGVDSNNDGIDDNASVVDTDGDLVPDLHDLDTDNDSIFDTVEAGLSDADQNALVDNPDDLIQDPIDSDNDGIADFRDLDSDGDGVNDIESTNNTNLDANNDGQIESVIDHDGDGIDDLQDLAPFVHGSRASDRDQDKDGIADITEGEINTDGDANDNYLDRDSDNDGLSDAFETDRPAPFLSDGDDDGIDDAYDVDDTGGVDANLDGVDDRFGEVDSDGDGTPDYLDTDSDNDGISDNEEQVLVTFTGIDSDDDGIDDAFDVDATGGLDENSDGIDDATQNQNDVDGDGIANFRDLDSDNDGVPDEIEGTNDTDNDGEKDYVDLDSDNDGISDEIENGDFNNDGTNDRLQEEDKVETGISGGGTFGVEVLGMILIFLLASKAKRIIGRHLRVVSFMAIAIQTASVQAEGSCDLSEILSEEKCWYLGAGMGLSQLQPEPHTTSWVSEDDTDAAFKFFTGYSFNDHLSLEATYEDMGTVTMVNLNPNITEPLEIDYRAFGATLGYWLRDQGKAWNVYARAGMSVLDAKQSENVRQDYGTQVTLGAGIQWHFTQNWFARLDLTSYDKDARVIGIVLARYFGGSSKPAPKPAPKPVVHTPKPVVPAVIQNPDLDNDGVINEKDNCPNTLSNTQVDNYGCPILEEITLNVQFDSSKSVIKAEFMQEILAVAEKIAQRGDVSVIVEGHTDSQGAQANNQLLSEGRATAVANALIQATDLSEDDFSIIGHGELKPIADNTTPQGRYKNRRVVVIILNK